MSVDRKLIEKAFLAGAQKAFDTIEVKSTKITEVSTDLSLVMDDDTMKEHCKEYTDKIVESLKSF